MGFGKTSTQALALYLQERGSKEGPLFLSSGNKNRIDGSTIYKVWDLPRQKAGLPKIPKAIHTFRSTFACRYPGDSLNLQRILGHSSLAMTQYYTEFNRALKAVDEQKKTSLTDRLVGQVDMGLGPTEPHSA